MTSISTPSAMESPAVLVIVASHCMPITIFPPFSKAIFRPRLIRLPLESVLSHFNKYPSHYLGTMLLGNNIALVIFGIYMDEELNPILGQYISSKIAVLIISTFLSTMLILITAEYLPKNIFRINPNRTLTLFVFPLSIVYGLLYPVVMITIGFSKDKLIV